MTLSHIRFGCRIDKEWGHWGFDLQLPSVKLRYANFKNSAPVASLQLTIGVFLWSVWFAVFLEKGK